MNNKIKKIGLVAAFFTVSLALIPLIIGFVIFILELLKCYGYGLNLPVSSGCAGVLPFIILPIPVLFVFIGILIFVDYLIILKLELQKNIKNYILNIFQKNRKQKVIALVIVSVLNLIIFFGKKYAYTEKDEISDTPIMISVGVFFIYYLIIFYLIRGIEFIVRKIKK